MPSPEPNAEIVIPAPSAEKTQEWILALAAAGFDYRLSLTDSGWIIHLPVTHAADAQREIDAYEADNRGWPPRPLPEPPAPPSTPASWSPVWVAGLLIAFYAWLGPYSAGNHILRTAAMDPESVNAGQLWRLATALTIHADAAHLVANLCSLLLLGHAACRLLGSGVAWMAILAASIMANGVEAKLFPHGSVSVGASTAAFAALGLLAAHRATELGFRWNFARPVAGRIALPVGAGIALLAILGTGPGTDFAAHALGLLGGAILGAGAAILHRLAHAPSAPGTVLPDWCQHALELAALALLMTAWRAALSTAG
ncbi:MAG: rhomboid family intramembrane serine protease [Lentisphaerae bacterium]|nr:rhomboid family intramembrane serine protease [Lentisphaerota bacterium]